jgi:hypothetical protein
VNGVTHFASLRKAMIRRAARARSPLMSIANVVGGCRVDSG